MNQDTKKIPHDEQTHTIKSKKYFSLSIQVVLGTLILAFMILFVALFLSIKLADRTHKNVLAQQQNFMQTTKNQLQSLQQQYNQQQDIINKLQTALTSLNKTQLSTEYVLNEVEYLVRLAQLNLTYQQDIAAAKLMLQKAIQSLITMSSPLLVTVRDAINADLARLNAMPIIDKISLIQRFDKLQKQIEMFPSYLYPALLYKKSINSTVNQASKANNWKEHLYQSWKAIQKLIVVRHWDEEAEQAFLTPNVQFSLTIHLKIMVEQAEWAMLHQNFPLYDSSLEKVTTFLEKYYGLKLNEIQSVLNEIKQLRQIKFVFEMPTLQASLDTIAKARTYSAKTT